MKPTLKLVTPPVEEPVSLTEAKAHLRVTGSSEDSLIGDCIAAARMWLEEQTGRAFITQTWDLWLDSFRTPYAQGQEPWWDGVREGPVSLLTQASNKIEIPKVPVASITSLTTWDDADDETAFDLANLIQDVESEPARLVLKTGAIWPVDLRPANGIRVRFVAGYGGASTVPAPLKQAVKLLLAHLFEQREPVVTGTIVAKVQLGLESLLAPYRQVRL